MTFPKKLTKDDYSPVFIAAFTKAWDRGIRVVDMAAALKTSPGTVTQISKRPGLPMRTRGRKPL